MPKETGKRFTQEEMAEIRINEKALRSDVEKQGYTILWTHYYREDPKVVAFVVLVDGNFECHKGRKYAATSCILLVGDEVMSRGFAVCSYEDQPLKVKGRLDSLQRALDVMNGTPDDGKLSRKGALNIDVPIYKGEAEPMLTSVESSRLSKIKPCEACRA